MSGVHFWDDLGSKWELSTVLQPDDLDDPRRTLRAWSDVAVHSFPVNVTIHGRRTEIIDGRLVNWRVHREPFLHPSGDIERDRPYAIVVRSVLARPKNALESPQQKTIDFYNWLIVEAEPPSQDTPQGWKELLLRACSRIYQYDKGSHDIYLICAIGLKYMPFYWDPKNTDTPAQELRLKIADEEEEEEEEEVHFPSQLRPALDCSPHVPNVKVGASPDQYRIDLSRLWSADPGQLDSEGQAMEPLTALESFLTHARKTPLLNPTEPIA
jgi:hypothetical protein